MVAIHRGMGDRMCQSTGATSDTLVELDFDGREAEPCSVLKPWNLSRGTGSQRNFSPKAGLT